MGTQSAHQYDVIVVGGGHAGCEAAAAAARLGRRVALVTLKLEHIARLSCNPAIGGLAKGNLVRELDALGGLMGRVTDASTLHFRVLNTRKGLAVRSSRAQVDIHRYPEHMRRALESLHGLALIEGEVAGVRTRGGRVSGVEMADGRVLQAPSVVLTTGTFLAGVMHRGAHREEGGRIGDGAAHRLSRSLGELGLRLSRLKTGTTPRVDGRTLDLDRLEPQPGCRGRFSFGPPVPQLPRLDCHIAYTHAGTHDLIRESLGDSPLFDGRITGTGPRYCPSIEDKVVRFAHRERHQLFLEPEGLDTHRVYVNGLSTSLPDDVQQRMVNSIAGLERARILQFGYAVEYDFADPRDLGPGLQHRGVPGLWLAGQINGTSGYEEAAAQGFVAGVSAARQEPLILGRDEAYIGVLVDDLITRGVGGEPYRMFTSRAEHRLLLREDNADRRLMRRGRELGLIDDTTWADFEGRQDEIARGLAGLERPVVPDGATLKRLSEHGIGTLRKPVRAEELLRRPEVDYAALARAVELPELSSEAAEQVETDVKYAGYLRRERARAEETRRMGTVALDGLEFADVPGLSSEVIERLGRSRPANLAAAARLPGITPAAVTTLAVYLAGRPR